MIIWAVSTILLLVLVSLAVIVLTERRRRSKGVLVSSSYRWLFIVGIVIIVLGIAAMVTFFFLGVPFYFGAPLFGMGIVYIVAGLINRSEWKRQLDRWLRG